MKNLIVASLLLIGTFPIIAQNIGINNTNPKVSLDINGGIAHRSITLTPYLNNVVIPDDASFVVISHIDVTGPVTIYFGGEYIDGRRLIIQNLSTFTATIFASNLNIGHNETKEFICKNPGGFYPINENNTNVGWKTTGNTGTNPTTNFIGTKDNNDLVFKTNDTEEMRLLSSPSKTELQLKSNFEDTINLLFAQRNAANEGIDFAFSQKNWLNGEYGLNISTKSNYPIFRHDHMMHLSAISGFIGIGTNSPFGKLTVGGHRNFGSNLPTLMLIDSSLTNENGSSIQFRNHIGAQNYQITSHFGNQPTGGDSYLTFSRNGFYHMRLRGDGNLGLGVINPTSKLDVNGDIAVSQNNKLEFGKGLSKESNAGTIGYQRFSDALDIVGAGENTDLSDRKVKIWAEGGTEMNGNAQVSGNAQINGNANINGTLKIDGNAGTTGQVLVSNGPSASPTWQSSPGSNMLPIAFGSIDGNTGAVLSGSGNFTALKYLGSGGVGIYGIIINGEDYSINTHSVVGTVNDISGPVFLQIAENDLVAQNGFMIHTNRLRFDLDANGLIIELFDSDFCFVMYKQQ